jgi:putative ABC transport system permease protein
MRSFLRNIHFGLRMIVKSPALSLAIILTLVLGIGCTTAIYTVVYATLLAPLPFPHPEQLMMIWSKAEAHRRSSSVGDFLDWKRQNKSFQRIAAWTWGSFNLSSETGPQQVDARICTPGWFDLQGLPFLMGRDFLDEEGIPGKDHVAILSHRLWLRLGADPNILGKSIRLNGEPYNVVGIQAEGVGDRYETELIVPLSFPPEQQGNHRLHYLAAMGRLKPNVTLAQAQTEMDSIATQIASGNPDTNTGWKTSVEPLKNDFLPPVRIKNLWLLLGAVGFVLVLTCVNIANLLVARGIVRQKEVAIRTSIGATRGQVFAQFLTESVVLALLGGALGVIAAKFVLILVLSIIPPGILPSEADFTLNTPVLLASLVITVFSGILFGSAPAWFASRVDPNTALKEGGRSGSVSALRSRKVLITGEFALALTLLSGAGLAIHSYWKLTHVDLGIRSQNVLTFRLEQPRNRFTSGDAMIAYQQTMLSAIHAIPGVTSAATLSGAPLLGPRIGGPFTFVGQESDQETLRRQGAPFQSVSPEYFGALGIQILKGRPFTSQDTADGVHVVVVNEKFAKTYLPGKDPIGVRLAIAPPPMAGVLQPNAAVQWEIVGVSHDLIYGDNRESIPEIAMPSVQLPVPSVSFVVRTSIDPAQIAKSLPLAVHAVDAEIALAHLSTLDSLKREIVGEERFTMLLFAAFAGLAVLLAGVGIYGLMSFSVSQRTQEIGVRLALGSGRSHVIRLVLKEASILVLLGLTLGIFGALLVGRTLQATLYGVGAIDFGVLLAVFAILGVTAIIASYLPARRAASIDPNQALRME